MKVGLARLLGCCAVLALNACSDTATDVELRLHACMLKGGLPTGVTLEIRSIDAMGTEIGAPLIKTFPIGPGVLDDSVATVGFVPPAGTVTADIKVTWTLGDESVVAIYLEPVPALGQSLSLMADQCEGGTSTTGEPTTTLDPSSGTTTDSTTGTGTDTGTSAGTTTDSTTSTGTSTSTSTSSTTDTTTSTTGTTTTDSTTETTTGTTGGGPMEGDDCNQVGELHCTGGPGALGEVLYCDGTTWVPGDLGLLCPIDVCGNLGLMAPQVVGCLGEGPGFSCACAEPQGECTMGMQSECGAPIGENVLVQVCEVDGNNTWHYVAECPKCELVDGQPLCTL